MSSSGHLALVPRLLGWRYADLPADARKTFEVALHAGSAPALALALRGRGGRDPHLLALTLAAARCGRARPRAADRAAAGRAALGGGGADRSPALALLAADRRPERRDQADALDHLAVGVAQAAALVPGVSRSGAALTAARWRGLSRNAAASPGAARGAAGHRRRGVAQRRARRARGRARRAARAGRRRRSGRVRVGAGVASAGAQDALERRRRLSRRARRDRALAGRSPRAVGAGAGAQPDLR